MRISKHLAAAAATAALLAGGLIIAPSANATPNRTASASSSVWCGAWDPNPANTTNKHLVAGPATNPDGSWVGLYEGDYNGKTYMWAYLGNARVGSIVDLGWQYRTNGAWYTCGDASGSDHATVWSGSNQTWTSGVPVNSVENWVIEQ